MDQLRGALQDIIAETHGDITLMETTVRHIALKALGYRVANCQLNYCPETGETWEPHSHLGADARMTARARRS